MNRLPILLAFLGIACGPGIHRQGGAVIPRYEGAPDNTEARYLRGMRYDPQDVAVEWRHIDTLLIAHRDRYSSGDVSGAACGGTGIFAVALSSEQVRPLGLGAPVCRALLAAGGHTLDPTGAVVFASVYSPINMSRLVRVKLPNGPLDTLQVACEVYAKEPDLAPNGDDLVFKGLCSGRDQPHYELYVVRRSGEELRQLPGQAGYDAGNPRWSPDGRRLVYVRTKLDNSGWNPEIFVIEADGTGRQLLAPGWAPAWSPDGKWIAYIPAAPSGKHESTIRVLRPDGRDGREIFRNRQRVTFSRGWGDIPEGLPTGRLVWSPDGEWLAFSRSFDRGEEVWRVKLATGELRRVTTGTR